MIWYRNLRMVPKIVLPVGLVLILALGVLTWQIQSRSSQAISNVAEREIAALAGQYGNAVQAFFEVAVDEGQAVGNLLSGMVQDGVMPSRSAMLSMIKGVLAGNEMFFAVGAVFEPNGFDGMDVTAKNTTGSDAKGRFVPYAVRGADMTALESFDNNVEYYAVPKTTKRPHLSEPYTFSVDGKSVLMTTISAPILVDGSFKGVVLVDLSVASIADIVNNITVYKTGTAAVITQSGVIVADKNPSLVTKNLFTDLRSAMTNPEAVQEAFRAGRPYAEVVENGGNSTVDFYYPISFRGTEQHWYVIISAPLSEVLAEATFISQLTIGMSAVALVLVLLLIFFVVRSSARPIGVLAEAAREIAAGRLDTPIRDEHFGGEVKELSTTLRNMIATLVENIEKAQALSEDAKAQAQKAEVAMRNAEEASRDASAKTVSMLKTAERLEEVAQVVSSASSQLSAQIEQSERGAMEQASRVTETATAMEEMNSTVLEVAKNAGSASDVSGSTRKKAEEGADVVRRAVSSISTVQQQSQTLKEDMTLLDENARSISHIMGVISDIADQTNLLALNAAIEAARAGEAGRGFAVVADEVRKLAEKTMMSTNDVSKAIQGIQSSVAKSMAQVDTTVGTIAEAATLAEQSGVALKEIVALAEHTADQVQAIATAAEQQSASSEEINLSIAQVNSIASETARAMQEAANAVSDLAAQAQALTGLIVDMKKG